MYAPQVFFIGAPQVFLCASEVCAGVRPVFCIQVYVGVCPMETFSSHVHPLVLLGCDGTGATQVFKEHRARGRCSTGAHMYSCDGLGTISDTF